MKDENEILEVLGDRSELVDGEVTRKVDKQSITIANSRIIRGSGFPDIAKSINSIPCKKCKELEKDLKYYKTGDNLLSKAILQVNFDNEEEISKLKDERKELEEQLKTLLEINLDNERKLNIYGKRGQTLYSENIKLKAEVERLKGIIDSHCLDR